METFCLLTYLEKCYSINNILDQWSKRVLLRSAIAQNGIQESRSHLIIACCMVCEVQVR